MSTLRWSRAVCDSQSHLRIRLFLPCFIICTPQAAIAHTANISVLERKEETCSKLKLIEDDENKENQEGWHENDEGTKVEVSDFDDVDEIADCRSS